MFSLYLFTIVFICLSLLVYQEPTQIPATNDAASEVNEPYVTIETIDTLQWITDFVAEVQPETQVDIAEVNSTAETKPTIADPQTIAPEASVETEEALTTETETIEARVKEVTQAMTKVDILNCIKRNGWWVSNISKLTKAELARVYVERQQYAKLA